MYKVEYFKLITSPRQTFKRIANEDNGNLLRQTDILFLLFSMTKGLDVFSYQEVWDSQTWEKGLAYTLMTVSTYVFTRYIFSFIIFKVASSFNSEANLSQVRFIFSHSYIPAIALSIFTVLRTILIVMKNDNSPIFYIQYYSSLLGFGLLIFILVAGLMELIQLKLWQALISISPLIIIFLISQ